MPTGTFHILSLGSLSYMSWNGNLKSLLALSIWSDALKRVIREHSDHEGKTLRDMPSHAALLGVVTRMKYNGDFLRFGIEKKGILTVLILVTVLVPPLCRDLGFCYFKKKKTESKKETRILKENKFHYSHRNLVYSLAGWKNFNPCFAISPLGTNHTMAMEGEKLFGNNGDFFFLFLWASLQ